MRDRENLNTKWMTALVVIFIFQIPLQYIFSPFKAWDELYGLLFVPLFFIWIIEQNYMITIEKSTLVIVSLLTLFTALGIFSSLKNHYQPLGIALLDCFLHLKFFLAMGASYILSRWVVHNQLYKNIWGKLRIIIIAIFGIVIADLFLHIFPATYRMGIRAESTIYHLPTNQAAMGIFLIVLLFRMYEYVKDKIIIYLGMSAIIVLTTLRAKALGGLLFAVFVFFIIVKQRKNFGIISWLVMGSGILTIASMQITKYYSLDNLKEVRNVLNLVGLKIANDYFPLGSGFATFGSAYSADPYSRIYYLYHVNHIWGMSKDYSSFISDTFWPMIFGQSGYLGAIIYGIVIIILFCKIIQLRKYNAYTYASTLLAFAYLIISSTSESSFVNPMSLPFAMFIGMAFAEKEWYEERRLLE